MTEKFRCDSSEWDLPEGEYTFEVLDIIGDTLYLLDVRTGRKFLSDVSEELFADLRDFGMKKYEFLEVVVGEGD